MASFRVERTHTADGSPLVTVEGSITAETAGTLSETMLGILESAPRLVTIDLSGAGYIASPGIGALVSFLRKTKQVGGDLVLRGVKPEVLELFHVTHLDRVFTIVQGDEVAQP